MIRYVLLYGRAISKFVVNMYKKIKYKSIIAEEYMVLQAVVSA